MGHSIQIIAGDFTLPGELNDTGTAGRIVEVLPIEARVNRWGDEIYFRIQASHDDDDAMRTEMEAGELAFWPPGRAFCIFWGPTPASLGHEPRAASDVVPVGKLTGDLSRLSQVEAGQTIRIEAAG